MGKTQNINHEPEEDEVSKTLPQNRTYSSNQHPSIENKIPIMVRLQVLRGIMQHRFLIPAQGT